MDIPYEYKANLWPPAVHPESQRKHCTVKYTLQEISSRSVRYGAGQVFTLQAPPLYWAGEDFFGAIPALPPGRPGPTPTHSLDGVPFLTTYF